MKKLSIKALMKDHFIKNVLTLLSGNMIAQVLNLLTAPVLSRIFTIEEFGYYTLFVSIHSIVIVMLHLQYDKAIIMETEDSQAAKLARLCVYLGGLLVLPIGLFVFIYLNTTEIAKNSSFFPVFIFLFLFSCVMSGINSPNTNLLMRHKRFAKAANAHVIYTVSYLAVSFVLKLVFRMEHAMLYGYAFSLLCNALYTSVTAGRLGLKHKGRLRIGEMKLLIHKHIRFPKFSFPSNIMNVVSGNLPSLMLTNFFGTSVSGLFGMAMRITGLPFTIIGWSVSTVYYQAASEAVSSGEKKRLTSLTKSTYIKLIYISVIPMSALMVFGDLLFAVVLGEQWRQAGQMSQLLSVLLTALFFSSPLSNLLNVLNKQKAGLLMNTLLLSAQTASLLLGHYVFHDYIVSVALFAFSGAFLRVMFNNYFLKTVGVARLSLNMKLLKVYGLTIAFMVVLRLTLNQ